MQSKSVFVLTEKGISEFFTDGIIHCWNRHITTWNPTTTSNILFTRNLWKETVYFTSLFIKLWFIASMKVPMFLQSTDSWNIHPFILVCSHFTSHTNVTTAIQTLQLFSFFSNNFLSFSLCSLVFSNIAMSYYCMYFNTYKSIFYLSCWMHSNKLTC